MALYYDPEYALAYYHRGVVAESMGNLTAAISDYTMAIRVDPRVAPAYEHRGAALAQRGELRAALEDYQRCLALLSPFHNSHRMAVEQQVMTLATRLENAK
jgi:tetratricopeptide (TPR) repeat protein